MADKVFANGREISCKKGDGKTICEFPDVCFTPPENPATPPGVPVPYPNTAFDKDTTEGSKTVMISGKEVMLKNISYFKTSTGDEAGAAAKKGIITSTNKGKAYFISWTMDVKFEGENVVRHLDMTTNNHASPLATGGVPQTHPISQATSGGKKKDPCRHRNNKKKRKYIVYEAQILDSNGKPTGEMYVGRSKGMPSETPNAIRDRRQTGHHRTDIGPLQVVCITDSYAAVRGAEEKHQKHYEAKGQSRSKDIKIGKKKLKKTQINPISPNNKNKQNYMDCAKQKNSTTCNICGS